jgi:hypothetical protein
MSFQTGIVTVMAGDATVNGLIDGGIYFDVLPKNFSLAKSWIVYNYQESGRVSVFGSKNLLTEYTFYAKIVSPDTASLLSITDALNSYLTAHTSSTFREITFVNDNHQNGIVDDTDVFENTIEYSILYEN